jgi:hypothetical protein
MSGKLSKRCHIFPDCTRNQQASRWRYVPPKRRLTLNGLHGVISQMMMLFITTAVKTSNPTVFVLSHLIFPHGSSSEDGIRFSEIVIRRFYKMLYISVHLILISLLTVLVTHRL